MNPYSATDPLMTNTSGSLYDDQVSNGQMTYQQIGGLGPEWEFDGAGANLLGDGNAGFLIRNEGSVEPGTIYVGEVVDGTAQYTQVGGLGSEWKFEGVDDFLGTGQSEFLVYNTGIFETGALYLGQIVGGAIQYTSLGGLGLEWQFEGVGDFLGDGKQGFLIRNTGSVEAGTLDVGEIVGGAVQYTQIGGVGAEWNFEGVGNFLGDGRTGFLLWNQGSAENGQLAVGEMVNGQLTFEDIGGLTPDFQFIGTGNYIDTNKTDFLIRNTQNGQLLVGSVGSGSVAYTLVGGVGSEWTFHNTSVATRT